MLTVAATACSTEVAPRRKGGLSSGPETQPRRSESSAVGLPLFLQSKLAISQPSDAYEQEADRVAEQVMRMPESKVQRQCAACASGGQSCPACEDEAPVAVSRKAEGAVAGEAPTSVHSTLRSSGQPLASSTRAFFEPRFGQDLSQVRVHTDPEAQQSAREVNALAYTVGSHVVFDAGRYAPHSPDGKRLLGHELTHVVQQTGSLPIQTNNMKEGSSSNVARTPPFKARVLARSKGTKVRTDKELLEIMQKFRAKNDHLTEAQQNKIFWAIKKATNSDNVAYELFDYYSGYLGAGHKILLMTSDEEANAKKNDTLAETPSGGDTKLRSDVLAMPDETLGPLLLHEFAHTGHHTNFMGTYDFEEGQAYGIEYYYAERTGDTKRMEKIILIISAAAKRWGSSQEAAVKKNFKVTYALMHALDDFTKSGTSSLPPLAGKVGEEDGPVMTAEFVSKFSDMSKDLTALWTHIETNLKAFAVPVLI